MPSRKGGKNWVSTNKHWQTWQVWPRGEGNPQLATLLTILDTLGLQIDINIKQLDYETM